MLNYTRNGELFLQRNDKSGGLKVLSIEIQVH